MTTHNDIPDEVVERVEQLIPASYMSGLSYLHAKTERVKLAREMIDAYRAAMREMGIIEINADDLPWGQAS